MLHANYGSLHASANIHVACSISKYMHGTYMFHVTCRDLGRFACMLHVRNMQHMLHEHVSSACNMHVTCM